MRRLFAAFLALVLLINISPFGAIYAITEENVQAESLLKAEADTVISAPDTNYILRSAAVKYTEGSGFLERGDTTGLYEDDPRIDTLLTAAPGQFNEPGKEWVWLAYKVSVPADGTYTLGVTTNSCKWSNFKIPMVVNREVYTLTFTAKAQTVTADVTLPAGEHVVTVFWPMPANESEVYPDEDWNSYLWCNIAAVTVDYELTASKPTEAEVEASLAPPEDTVIPAPDTNYILRSAAVKYTEGSGFLERGDTTGLYEDDPRIDTLLTAAPGQFNEPGKEWVWLAYKVSVPADGTYTLGVTTNSCKWSNFKIPMVVNREVYTLTFTAKAQTVTADVTLPAGEHVVTVFWPMPANESEVYPNEDWNSYLWCNIAAVTVDYELTVSKPTETEVEASFTDPVADSPLNGQSVLFVGDSITYSAKSWASKIGTLYNMDWTNSGVSGATVSDLKDRIIRHQLMINAGKDYNYVIMHGGMNDAAVQVGAVSDSWNVADFDTSTYAGALETMFYYAYENFSGAKLGYIVNYATPNADTDKWAGTQDMSAHFAEGKKVCEKWGISYIDLYSGTTADGRSYSYDILQVDTNAAHFINNDPHEIHLSDEGYQVISPYIADWMETLTEKTSPIPETNSGKHIDTVNGDKVLYSSFTPKSEYVDGLATVGLQDRVYTDMAEDQATIELLPYAKDMLGDWAFASIAVDAAEDGEYTFRVEMSAKVSYQMGMLVDGEAYTLTYTKQSGHYQFMEQTVSLTKGTHYITFTAAMPNNSSELEGDAWNVYPWTNIAAIVVDEGLQVLSKPALEDVTANLQTYTPAPVTVSAVDTDRILLSATIKKNAASLGRTDQTTLKADQPTIETLYSDAFGQFNAPGEEWNWFAYKVTVPEDGTYALGVKTAGSKVASYKLPLCVNGNAYALQYTAKSQEVTVEVALPAGEHVVVMFMPMPAAHADITGNEWNDYHWCDVESVTVDGWLKVSKPTVEEVKACFPDPVGDSPLKEQSVLFVGDSITHSRYSWASVIGSAYRMDWTNGGVNGAAISDASARIIRHQLMTNTDKACDYVILHGGINDAMSSVAIGTVSDSFSVADFDTETYIGGLETLFYYTYENFPGAKIGYIINYATPNSKFGGYTAGDDTKAYYEEAKKACDKWGIPYIDLYSGTAPDGRSYSFDILQVDTAAENFINNDAQEIHLSAAGYALISPYIADWMETLTENTNPIPAANSGRHINANDEDKVLCSNFTPKSEYVDGLATVGLQDRVYTGMAEDQATIELLPYAKDMLGDWAFASIAVDAAEDGEYTFRVEMSSKVSYQMGMLVDGEVYTLTYAKQNGHYQFMEQTVSLTKGTHYITFTTAMPNNDNELDGDAWNVYPWTNIAAIVVDEGLQVLSKPALEDVTAKLQPYTPAYTRVEAENTEYVLYNNYNTPDESNTAASGGMVVGGAWNSTYQQTFSELKNWMNFKGNAYVEYAVEAPADGEYDIRVAFLAGSNDKTIAKPYIAVIVNDTTYQAQFTKNWNQIDKVKLTVTLKKGLNIIRCTSMTTEQEIYRVRGWINHDFLDLDTRLTPCPRSSPVVLEAENSKYFNKLKVQDGGKTEAASGKVLGGSDRRYVSALKLTLDQLTENNLRQVPYMSFTVTAPQNGYYPIRVGMAADGRLKKSTVGMMVDGRMHAVEYSRTDKTTKGAMVETLVYLTAGSHVITFTTPMPATTDPAAIYSYYWANFDYVMLYDGLALSGNQKAPVSEAEYVRIEVEDYAMFNLNKNNGTAAGNANYKCSQSVEQMLENGIDGSKTPYIELTVQADQSGSYVLYVGANAGMTEGNTIDEVDTQLVVEVNGTLGTQWVHATKSTNYTILPLKVDLGRGTNIIRLTHLSGDARYGGTTWIDFDYIEMPAWETQQITFIKPGETLEAETARYDGFGESLGSSYSGGRYLGRANYDTVAEVNITYDTMDPADISGLPHVTYRVFAEKAGTYAVTVGFGAGLTNYTPEEIRQGVAASFVAIVNGETKQRVEFMLGSTSANMTRLILVELKEGENEVTVTGTTSEYVIDRIPRNDETYRLVWIDQDYLLLSGDLSNLGQEVDPFDVEDSAYDFSQLVPREPSKTPAGEQPDGNGSAQQPKIPVIVWILTGIGVLAIPLIIILIGRKRKKEKE